MKKILFVINTMGRAGAETALIQLMKELLKSGEYDISLFAIIPMGELFANVPSEVHILNKKVSLHSVLSQKGRTSIAVESGKAFFRRGTGFKDFGYLIRNAVEQQKLRGTIQFDKLLWRLLSDGAPIINEEFDLAVAYIEGASAYYLADHVHAKKKAAFIHIDYQQAGYTPLMDQDCFDAMDKIFVVSNEVGKKFSEVYPKYAHKVTLFHNLLDAELIRKKAEESGFEDGFDGIRLVTVGRLHYQKAYDIAIEACAKIRKDGYPIRWYIIGDGIERANLEKQIKQFGVEQDFVLMGVKPNPYPFVKQADLYVHATRFEGKSIAIEEAQILCKPIVASNCTGNTEQIIDGVDGVLLELNAENLVNTIERVLDDSELRTKISRNVALKNWDNKEHLRKLTEMMED